MSSTLGKHRSSTTIASQDVDANTDTNSNARNKNADAGNAYVGNTEPGIERPLLEADRQAEVFEYVRRAHMMESTEDYVELIDDLIRGCGEARLVDIAERLGISQPTAGRTIARLQRDGFVTSEPYRSIFLTRKGRDLARRSRRRHDIVYRFLLAIGLSEETAKRDSEGVEHHVSDDTLAAFERIIDKRAARS